MDGRKEKSLPENRRRKLKLSQKSPAFTGLSPAMKRRGDRHHMDADGPSPIFTSGLHNGWAGADVRRARPERSFGETTMRSTTAAAGFAVLLATTPLALAQTGPTDPTTMPGAIKGTMDIKFNTRTAIDTTGKAPQGSPAIGARDVYATNLEVLNSVLFQGNIERQPWMPTAVLGRTLQDGYVGYDLKATLRNPSNPNQTVALGGWIGGMTLDGNGKYSLNQPPEGKGRLRIATNTVGNVPGFTSNYSGEMLGRMPAQAGLWGVADRASRQATKTYSRYVNGQTVTVTVKGADPLAFNNVTLAQGPVATYPETKLSGSIDYDAEEGNWYVDVTASYAVGGKAMQDRYSGTIRWQEDPARKQNGKGAYAVNVRVNEKPASEADTFKSATASIEDAFFAPDNTVPGFGGTVSYVDTFQAGDKVIASKVAYAVDANQVSRVQTMNFAKILMLMIGPFNDE
jgi:hypothetical protein